MRSARSAMLMAPYNSMAAGPPRVGVAAPLVLGFPQGMGAAHGRRAIRRSAAAAAPARPAVLLACAGIHLQSICLDLSVYRDRGRDSLFRVALGLRGLQ